MDLTRGPRRARQVAAHAAASNAGSDALQPPEDAAATGPDASQPARGQIVTPNALHRTPEGFGALGGGDGLGIGAGHSNPLSSGPSLPPVHPFRLHRVGFLVPCNLPFVVLDHAVRWPPPLHFICTLPLFV
ncbi:unnamed protein product [Clonostachys chloroleuca]|uniref:Uncharacterized protein n=1 Tax=Clonostachys chloroleuca TaxID=1926264 RepID=A0AA35MHI9_9HYPO|nr:unnamed protein product [Clonostachys chloroleuca]